MVEKKIIRCKKCGGELEYTGEIIQHDLIYADEYVYVCTACKRRYPLMKKEIERLENNLIDVANFLNEDYGIYGKEFYEIGKKIEMLRTAIVNPQVSVEDKFSIVAGFMDIFEQYFKINSYKSYR